MHLDSPISPIASDKTKTSIPFYPHLDIDSLEKSRGEYLSCWQCEHAIYHVSYRLADSVPQAVRNAWLRERQVLMDAIKLHANEVPETLQHRLNFLYSDYIEKYLDAGNGQSYLKRDEIAEMIAGSFTQFNNVRYRLHAWCIMPNHVHVIVEPLPAYELSKIVQAWKSYSAHVANKMLGLKGTFWQADDYNHIIRSLKEYHFQIRYTWENPDKAKLKNWKWRWKAELEDVRRSSD